MKRITVPADGTPARLAFGGPDVGPRGKDPGPARLRIVIAADVRENRKIEVRTEGSAIGVFDIRFAYIFQPFDLSVDGNTAMDLLDHGAELRMIEGEVDTVLFAESGDEFLQPRLFYDRDYADPEQEFYRRLYSAASIQPFGWMEGCVLDGMLTAHRRGDRRALPAIRLHLGNYIRRGRLVYEDPRGVMREGDVYGIEGCLPFAIMAILSREGVSGTAEAVAAFLRFIEGFRGSTLITDAEFVSAEGSYTIAYPLAALAASTGDRSMAETAVRELLERKRLLRDGRVLYLRAGGCMDTGERTFRNWGRAYAWYLLGLVQTLGRLKAVNLPFPDELVRELRTVAETSAERFTPEGLCHAFLGESETGEETSAAAGIAAAYALGSHYGFLDASFRERAERTRRSLIPWLTADGMLGGISQSNRDGERLQRSGYRVISQMGMGLMAHL